ncbi:mCG1040264, partial [Mus musculus]
TSGEIPNTTNLRSTEPRESPLGSIFRMVHMGTIIYERQSLSPYRVQHFDHSGWAASPWDSPVPVFPDVGLFI